MQFKGKQNDECPSPALGHPLPSDGRGQGEGCGYPHCFGSLNTYHFQNTLLDSSWPSSSSDVLQIAKGWRDLTIIADGLRWAAIHCFRRCLQLFRRGWLMVGDGNADFVMATKNIRSGFTAEIAIDARSVHVERAGRVALVFFISVCHTKAASTANVIA